MASMGLAPPEEVVIDGDSTEDDEDVAVVPPPSRKRKRASLIADEEDEADDYDSAGDSSTAARERDAAVATPTSRTVQSKLNFVEVRRLERGPNGDGEDEDEDDEVEIVGPPVRTTPGPSGSGRKSGRLTILESDDEQEPEEQERRQSVGASSRGTGRRSSLTPAAQQGEERQPQSTSSSSRRSTRIEKKRKEKEILSSITRRLDYPVLDNCLDRSGEEAKANDSDYQDEDYGDDGEDDDEVAQEETFRRPKKRQRRETEREVLRADGGEDMDEFIVGDDEIEYMDDDEKGVISVESSDSEGELDAAEEMEAMRATRSRDQLDWFAIYLEYLEESMVDPELDHKMRRYKNKPHFRTFHEAIRHIERVICSRRDALRVNIVWPDELIDAIDNASQVRWEREEAGVDCEACNRSGHPATFRVFYSGVACDATELYRDGWMERLREAMKEASPVRARFDVGSTCHSRTLVYWQLLHAKQMLCAIVDAKRRENSTRNGRIPQGLRDEFYKKEYGRFKRLLGLVDRFSTETRQGISYIPNVWKNVTRKHLVSEFLPAPAAQHSGSRRGTLDSLVAESDDEEEEDEEEVMEQLESRRLSSSSSYAAAAATGDSDEEKAPIPSARPEQGKRAPVTETQPPASSNVANEDDKKLVVGSKSEPQDYDDLMCLVCHKRPRDAAVVHGLYVHYYSCYGCAKNQLRAKDGCSVCDRHIDQVLRMLPLTPEMRRAIANESEKP